MNVTQVSRAEFDALQSSQKQTHEMVAEMHRALMVPQVGHERSLVQRMAEVTIRVETGDRVISLTIRLAAFLAAVGAIVAFFKWSNP